MTTVEKTDDEIGFRPDQVQPTATAVSFGDRTAKVEVPRAGHARDRCPA